MNKLIQEEDIKSKIHTIRNVKVMLDRDLAELYEVGTKRLNEQVKRNIERFPEEFMFRLTETDYDSLRSHFATLKYETNLKSQIVTSRYEEDLKSQNATSRFEWGGRRKLPYVFTEQGVAMLAGVLKSKTAINISINIINAFVEMRRFISKNADVFSRLEGIEKRQIGYQIETDDKFKKIFDAIEDKSFKKKQGIFYNGQIFDAHNFISNIIRSANKSIILIDNYIDDSVLTLFTKTDADITIYTKNISKQLKQDIKKYNTQHKPIKLELFKHAHDRFMIIDNKEVYHIGASLKDLGKKWFAFSKFNRKAVEILGKLN